MANNLAIGLVIGAALSSGFKAAFSSAQQSTERLGQAITKTQQKQQKLGDKLSNLRQKQAELYAQMSRDSAKGGLALAKMGKRYERIVHQISRVKAKQQDYTRAIEKSIQTQSKLQKAISWQDANRHFIDAQKGKFTSNFMQGAAIAATGSGVMRIFMQQEESANNLKIAMMKADGTFGKFNEIGKIADQLGTDLPGTREDFYKLAKAMKMQGVSDDTLINNGLKTSAKLNVLLDMDQEAGGEFFAKMMEAHGLSEAELGTSADDLQRAMFAAGMNKEDMYGAMTYYASKVRSMGLTGRENSQKIFAIEGLAAQQGLEGTAFGTNFTEMLNRMSKGPKMIAEAKKGMKAEAAEIMEKSGVKFNFWDKKGNFKGIDAMVKELEKLEVIRKKFGDQAAEDVADALFGEQGKRVATLLASKGTAGLQDFLKKMKDQASLEERVKQKTKTLSAALEALGGAWESAVGNVGAVFADDIKQFAKLLQSTVEKYTPLIEQNKALIKTVAGAIAGFIGFKLAVSGMAIVTSSVISPFLTLYAGFRRFQALLTVFNLWRTTSNFGAFGNVVRKIGKVVIGTSSSIASGFSLVARGAVMKTTGLFRTLLGWGQRLIALLPVLGGKILSLAKVLGGALVKGITLAGKAMLFLGRAMLTNPIGLAITAIALGAYLIYQYWEPIKAFFGDLWTNIKTFFNSGIGNITATILNWSPLGLFYKVFAGVLSWFGIDLPNNFTEFGKNIINGLVNGINQAWESAKQTVSELGDSVKNWFTEKLGIHSPSRVFMGYGENTVDGLVIGVAKSAMKAANAVSGMGEKMQQAMPKALSVPAIETALALTNKLPQVTSVKTAQSTLSAKTKSTVRKHTVNRAAADAATAALTASYLPSSLRQSVQQKSKPKPLQEALQQRNVAVREQTKDNAITVTFNPTINVNGASGQGVIEQVQQGLQMSLREFEQMINRVVDQKMRRSY